MKAIISAVVVFIVVIMIMALIMALPAMLLWNWLMPTIFGLTTISFWQTLGLVVLARIFFNNGGSFAKKSD